MATRHKHRSRALSLYRPRASKPIVIRTTKVVKAKKHHRRHHHGGSMGGLFSKTRMGLVVGALAVGFLEKQSFMQSLPKLPIVGTLGTIGLGAYLLSDGGKNKIADEVATAALVLAARDLGNAAPAVIGEDEFDTSGIGYVAGY